MTNKLDSDGRTIPLNNSKPNDKLKRDLFGQPIVTNDNRVTTAYLKRMVNRLKDAPAEPLGGLLKGQPFSPEILVMAKA
jgi:hypothetical protein